MATSAKLPQPVEKFCVVCGLGSHRVDWQSRDNPACDGHTQAEVAAAIQAKAPKPTKPVAAPTPTPAPAPGTPGTQTTPPTNGPKT